MYEAVKTLKQYQEAHHQHWNNEGSNTRSVLLKSVNLGKMPKQTFSGSLANCSVG